MTLKNLLAHPNRFRTNWHCFNRCLTAASGLTPTARLSAAVSAIGKHDHERRAHLYILLAW